MTPLLFVVLLFAPQTQPPEKCSLSGIVVNSVTGEPLNKVNLILRPLDRAAGPVATATTNVQGRFKMLDLDPGRYSLGGTRNGYLETSYGAKSPDRPGSVIQLIPGQCPGEWKFKLTPFGVVAGTVRDSDGEPLIEARVTIWTRTFENGKPQIEGLDTVDTDDRGEYRFRNLQPGRYYISAEPLGTPEWNTVDRSPGSRQPEDASIPTFYPGVQYRATAAPIEIATGARVTGIDVRLLKTQSFNVTGRVILPAGAHADRVNISLTELGGATDHTRHAAAKNTDGDFELRGVLPGSYRLTASGGSFQGAMRIEVIGSDLEGIRVPIGLTEVKGRIVIEGDKKPKFVDDVMGFRMAFMTEEKALLAARVAADGTFQTSLLADHYTLVPFGEWPHGFYVKSIRAGDLDILNDGLTVEQSGIAGIEVVLASDGGKLDGIVSPPSGATIVLIPSRRARTDLFKTAATDQYGHYEFNSVPPGDYKVFAWDDVEPGAWFDHDFVKDFEKFGERVTVQPNGHASVQLRISSLEPQ